MTLLIMAAGMGSRYGGIKQIEPIGKHDELIIDYSIYDAVLAGFDKVVFVIRREIEKDFCKRIFNRIRKKVKAEYVFQDLTEVPAGFKIPADRTKPWGTVHAILAARDSLKDPFCVINADDFYGREAYVKTAEFFKNLSKDDKYKYVLVGYKVRTTLSEQGTVSRGICAVDSNNMITEINERLKVERRSGKMGYTLDGDDFYEIDEDADAAVNFFGFTPDVIPLLAERFKAFLREKIEVPKSEYQVSIALNDLLKSGKITMKKLSSADTWLGFTYPEDKLIVQAELEKQTRKGIYPSPLWG